MLTIFYYYVALMKNSFSMLTEIQTDDHCFYIHDIGPYVKMNKAIFIKIKSRPDRTQTVPENQTNNTDSGEHLL